MNPNQAQDEAGYPEDAFAEAIHSILAPDAEQVVEGVPAAFLVRLELPSGTVDVDSRLIDSYYVEVAKELSKAKNAGIAIKGPLKAIHDTYPAIKAADMRAVFTARWKGEQGKFSAKSTIEQALNAGRV